MRPTASQLDVLQRLSDADAVLLPETAVDLADVPVNTWNRLTSGGLVATAIDRRGRTARFLTADGVNELAAAKQRAAA